MPRSDPLLRNFVLLLAGYVAGMAGTQAARGLPLTGADWLRISTGGVVFAALMAAGLRWLSRNKPRR